jgi:hypothetical protein
MHPKQKGIVVPDFEGFKVFNNLHAVHQSATGADRQIVLSVELGKLSIVDGEVISHSAAVLASFDH